MRNASGHNYRNSAVIVDLAMGQMSPSTGRCSFVIETGVTMSLTLMNECSLWYILHWREDSIIA